jgi:subtilisin family serine protease
MVKFDYDAAASYAGGLKGLRATSPEATGRHLTRSSSALSAYLDYAKDVEASVVRRISARVPAAQVLSRFRLAYGGAALRLPANQIGRLLTVDGVVAVQRDKLSQPQTDTTPRFIGATRAWRNIAGPQTSGEGVIVGVLDTGVWPEHPSFEDPGVDHPGGSFGCEFGDGSDPLLGDSFACNDKLVGAYAFTDTYMEFIGAEEGEFCNNTTDVCSPRDANGHGTHTSTTAAGAGVDDVDIFDIPKPPISGMAPGAHVIGFRVCLEQGCFTSDSVAAVEQAILDGVDVINFSISGGNNPFTDAVELAFLDAYAAGILVNASAGNSGPGAGTADHAGPWTNTVGASTSNRHWLSTLHMTADNGDTLEATGSTIAPAIETATDVVDAADVPGYADATCETPLPAGSVTGKVVLCQASFLRNVRVHNVMEGGGVGVILYNLDLQEMFTDNFWLPTIMLESEEQSQSMIDFFNAHTGVTAQWDTGEASPVRGDRMTNFSSRGPLGDWIKPDVTAPGMQILAGTTPEPTPVAIASGPPGELFQSIAGTSMSSPHSAGVAALVKAAHPSWTPGQIKSALMTSSIQNVLKEDGETPADPFDRGAGSIRANRAINPTVTFDVGAGQYLASANDPLHRADLNLPSINVPVMSGQVSTERTFENVSGRRQEFVVEVTEPADADINVTPSEFSLGRSAIRTIDITINGELLGDGQYFGQIKLVAEGPGNTDASIPVAFDKAQGEVSLTHECSPDIIFVSETTSCTVEATNLSTSSAANVDLEVRGPEGVVLSNPSEPTTDLPNGFRWSGTLEEGAAPTIDAITPGGTGIGYLPLAGFGVPPIPDVEDETLVNLDVPTYLYGSEAYDRVAITSNGYAVVGGGESNDLDFVPQTLPDPARPNNTLAAFWTDLNPEDGGNLFAAEIEDTDTGQVWIVLEWAEVPTFTDGEAESFQIWIEEETTPGTEAISYEYGTITDPAGDSGVGVTVGAENRDGTSGVMLQEPVATDDEFSIETSPPEPGGSVAIVYDAKGRRRGTYQIPGRLTSDITVGTTTDFALLRVRSP